MAVNLSMLAGAGAQFFDNSGVPLSGGLVYTYAAGTTTPQTTYTTSAGSTAHTNPIVLDSAGRVPSGGEIWLTDSVSYKFVLKTSAAVLIATYDNITGNSSGIYATFAASSGSSLVGYTEGATGAVATTVQTKLREFVSVKDFGAKGDGTTDDTAAFQAAINTGQHVLINKGTYKITDQLNLNTTGQVIQGDGRSIAIISIGSSFNLSASAVFNIKIGEPGPEFKDFAIKFTQPDTNVRANLVAYPPAILAKSTGTPRINIDCIRISNAKTAIDLRGNSGGTNINNCELSAYDYHIKINGSLDVIQISNTRCYSFDMTTLNLVIYQEQQTIGIHAGRVDGLLVVNTMFICGLQVNLYKDVTLGAGFGTFTNCEFDAFNGMKMEDGIYLVSNSFFSNQVSGFESIEQTGGKLTVSNCQFLIGATTGVKFIAVSNIANTRTYLAVANCLFSSAGYDMYCVYANTAVGIVNLIVSNCQFDSDINTSYTLAKIYAGANVQATIIDNQITDKGTGTGDFINVVDAGGDTVAQNSFAGYTLTAPTSLAAINIKDNIGIGSASGGDYYNNYVVGSPFTILYQGTLDGSGNGVFAHGITTAQRRVISWAIEYQGASLEMKPMSINYVDGTNIAITGGTAAAKYKAYITFVNTAIAW